MSGGSTSQLTDEIDLMILEYLGHAGYDAAASEMQQHIRDRKQAAETGQAGESSVWRPSGKEAATRIKGRILAALERGDRDETLKLWNAFVPPLLRRTDKAAQKMEFYLHIFFAIYPAHASNPAPDRALLKGSMQKFKHYLETDGAALAVTQEFLAYYAMPYVPEITYHPSFKDLFSREWGSALRSRLSDFLETTPQFAAEPKLISMWRSHREFDSSFGAVANGHGAPPQSQSAPRSAPQSTHPADLAAGELQALSLRMRDVEQRAAEARQDAAAREAAMQRGSFEAVGLAGELLRALQSGRSLADSEMHYYADRLTSAAARLGLHAAEQPISSAESAPRRGDDAIEHGMTHLAALDYDKLKQALRSRAADAPLLLQALRWRLSKPALRQRRAALAQYVQTGLLGADVLGALLDPAGSTPTLREQTLRLINAIASESAGRSYLLTQPQLVPQLCAVLRLEQSDSIGRQNALGALQKLSLRRAPQDAMIEADVVSWLATALGKVDDLSLYSVEYGTALLMNLSLRTAGKAKCTAPQLDILSVLSQLMESDSMQVRTYVNGTLYSILSSAALKERASQIGLPDSLRALIEHSDETLGRQIEYILDQIESPPADADARSDAGEEEEDDEERDDDDELEEEETDLFVETALPTEATAGASGEELLCSRYLAGVAEAQHEADALRAAQQETLARRRAVTPANADGRPTRQGDTQAANVDPSGDGGGGIGGGGGGRKRHSADEPLQRPTTPSSRATKQQQMQQARASSRQPRQQRRPAPHAPRSGRLNGVSGAEPDAVLTDAELEVVVEDAETSPVAMAVDPEEVIAESPAGVPQEAPFAMRIKIPRTPLVKSREEGVSLQFPSGSAAPVRKPPVPKKPGARPSVHR